MYTLCRTASGYISNTVADFVSDRGYTLFTEYTVEYDIKPAEYMYMKGETAISWGNRHIWISVKRNRLGKPPDFVLICLH